MVIIKSLDDGLTLIAAILHDVHDIHGDWFNNRALTLTYRKIEKRVRAEGMSFLTKTLPRLGKHFDSALTGSTRLNRTALGFTPKYGTELPRFLGEFFKRVFHPSGALLEHPCITSVGVIRQICYLYYKYELPYSDEQEQQVIQKFKETEDDLTTIEPYLQKLEAAVRNSNVQNSRPLDEDFSTLNIIRRARNVLNDVFRTFDPLDIHPKHGPGAVATKQRLSGKYKWTNVASSITDVYPFDAYFCASLGHVCDRYNEFELIASQSLPAKVVLVPKDSRGPRLISCEPVDYQWIQQGLGRAIVVHAERHPLTRDNVRFTNQSPNRNAALAGSYNGRYATLDLKEASDRVSTALVRLLFPDHLYKYLEACRSLSTTLPNGEILPLKKFAPMGSALCFPILALTVWALLRAVTDDADTIKSIYVYGDDVIVPTTFVENAIEQLEAFGLKVNRDKSCTSGFFRESCGMDAYKGVDVTPIRLRTVWSSKPSPDVYTSWIAYANSFYDKRYYHTYYEIVRRLLDVYQEIPSDDMCLTCPSLRDVPDRGRPKKRRVNKSLQKLEYRVYDIKSPVVTQEMDGWLMLLRYFAEATSDLPLSPTQKHESRTCILMEQSAFSVSEYTKRKTSMLVKRWR